jgi:hypothetical protein
MTRTYRSGEAATVGNGRQFNLHCSHCDTPHALHHAINDSGEIEMRVFPGGSAHSFTDAAPNRRVPMSPTPRRYQTDDDDEAYRDVFDPVTGVIRDGKKIRVGLQAMDAAPPRPALPAAPMVIGATSYRKSPLRHLYYRDGTPKTPETRAARAKAAAAGTTNDAASAYNLYVSELNDAWKSPERRAQDARDAARVDPPKPADYIERFPGEWQRELATRELVRDSNRPSPGTRWGDAVDPHEGGCRNLVASTRSAAGLTHFRPKARVVRRARATSARGSVVRMDFCIAKFVQCRAASAFCSSVSGIGPAEAEPSSSRGDTLPLC